MILKIGANVASVNGNNINMNDKFVVRNVAAMIKAALLKKGK
jgi:hypothetical protein